MSVFNDRECQISVIAHMHANPPRIYFFVGARVVSDADFKLLLRWCSAAQQVVDAVGVFCYEPVGDSLTSYRRKPGVPTDLAIERVLYRACLDLGAIRDTDTRQRT